MLPAATARCAETAAGRVSTERDAFGMTNIPTELLRTLVAVVDLRSFTKAAQSLGVTQPAVSAQIKRLQGLLGTDLLDKSAPGVSLTPSGDLVVNYARRLLSINDQILDLAGAKSSDEVVRIGATGDFADYEISLALPCFRSRHDNARFVLRNGFMDDLLREMREGDLDIIVWVSGIGPTMEARHCWTEDLVWLRGTATQIEPGRPVPLVSYGEDCPFTRTAIAALNGAGRDSEIVYQSIGISGLSAAVAAGLGVFVLPRNRAKLPGVSIWEDAPLPKLPSVFCGIYVRTGGDMSARNDLADTIAAALRLRAQALGAKSGALAPHPAAAGAAG